MEHVVFHPGPDGSPSFRRFSSLDEAVRFVEHLRNVEGVTEVSVHALTPVPVAFRAYYRVEVPGEPADAAAAVAPMVDEMPMPVLEPVADALPSAEAGPVADAMPDFEPVPVQAQPADVQFAEAVAPVAEPASNGKRSLGFFAH